MFVWLSFIRYTSISNKIFYNNNNQNNNNYKIFCTRNEYSIHTPRALCVAGFSSVLLNFYHILIHVLKLLRNCYTLSSEIITATYIVLEQIAYSTFFLTKHIPTYIFKYYHKIKQTSLTFASLCACLVLNFKTKKLYFKSHSHLNL